MSTMGERLVLERTITVENGRTVLYERRMLGVLDADGVFRLRAYRAKRFSVQQELKNERPAA